ncbi:MAG: alpha/beta hydrolase family protein [Acidimicrobiales bacterium]
MASIAVHAYGPAPSQHGSLHVPDGSGPHPVVVLLHGGFWWHRFDRSIMMPLAIDLVGRGYAVWNLEYRRVGEPGGGWPGTLVDVGDGIDRLASIGPGRGLATDRVVAVGHSAGGQLALWAAARPGLPDDVPGAGRDSGVTLRAAVAQAGVSDLRTAAALDLGPGAVVGLLGGRPDQQPARYALASPIERLPLGVPQLLVHGARDRLVPVAMSRAYAAAGRGAGDRVELVEWPGIGHFEVIDPAHPSWAAVVERLPDLVTA